MTDTNQEFDEEKFKSHRLDAEWKGFSPEEEEKLKERQKRNTAFRLAPKYAEEIVLGNLSPQQFLVAALEAAKKLGWKIGYTGQLGFIAYSKASWSSWNEKIEVRVGKLKVHLSSQCLGSQLFDWGKNKKNIDRLLATLDHIASTLTPEELSQNYEALKPDLVSQEDDILGPPPAESGNKWSNFLSIFIPAEGYFITPILINLNIAVFLLMVISGVNFFLPSSESLIHWGANIRVLTLDGQWWRLLTCCFLHIGIFHLLMNMYALLYIGFLLEPHLGKARFLTAYLLTGIASSMTSLYWHDFIVSAGASGAIFGLYGVFLALLTSNLFDKAEGRALLTSISVFVVYNLLNGIKGGIDNAAHVGGLVSGIIIGYAFIPGLKRPAAKNLQVATIALLAISVLSASYVTYHKIPNDLLVYQNGMKDFAVKEQNALEVLRTSSENMDKKTRLSKIRNEGINNWRQSIGMIKELDKLHVPSVLHHNDSILLEYLNLRIASYEFYYTAVNDNNAQIKDSLQWYNDKITGLVGQLNQKP